ncbi:MAG: hypothetical protein PHP82_02120 [Candidatus ainarchaeum sp.]|nr:hypothetical protein [Candidatus ainarchaeum sp.]
MYLGNPSLPLNISLKEATHIVENALKDNNWINFTLKKTNLILFPYFYLNYHYFTEKIVSNEKVVENSFDGIIAIDGSILKINKEISEVIKKNLDKLTNNAPKINFSKVEVNINKKEINDVVKLKIAEYFKIPKQNVLISNTKTIFFPIYELIFDISGKEHSIKVGAVEGNIINVEEIPFREKNVSEITKETLTELSNPKAWVKYAKELFSKSFSITSEKVKKRSKVKKEVQSKNNFKKIDISFFSSKIVLLIIILLALFLIFLALFN